MKLLPSLRSMLLLASYIGISAQAAPIPRLLDIPAGSRAIEVRDFVVQTQISGSLAETTVTLTLFNPNSRPLEGNLHFPLASGQKITAFALDIGGKLRAAVPVEKEKGQQIFEEVERRRVDPGLLEMTQGDNFQLRVFPIPPQGTRTVELHYLEAMQRSGGNWRYRLPLEYGDAINNISVALTVNSATDSSRTPKLPNIRSDKQMNLEKDRYRLTLGQSDLPSHEALEVLVPAQASTQVAIQEFQGDAYFVAEVPIPTERHPRTLAHRIGLLWDASGSGKNRDHDAEFALLERYFQAVDHAEVNLIVLRDASEAPRRFLIEHGKWDGLRKALQSLPYDGASALGDWQVDPKVEEYLMFSDGLSNFGAKTFPELGEHQRLFTLDAASVGDSDLLQTWATHRHGRLIQLDPHDINVNAQQLLTEGVTLQSMSAEGATDLETEDPAPGGGIMRIAGRMTSGNGTLHLNLNGQSHGIDLALKRDFSVHSLAAYLWASYRLRSMGQDYDLHRAEARRICLKFGIPNKETSLLVLESLDDYVRYQVPPPPELRKEFDARIATQASLMRARSTDHLESIVRAFEEKRKWWATDYGKLRMAAPSKLGRSGFVPPPKVESPPPPPEVVYVPVPAPSPAPSATIVAPRTASNPQESTQRLDVAGGNIRRADNDTASPVRRIAAQEPAKSSDSDAYVKDSHEPTSNAAAIRIKSWTPNAPYLNRFTHAPSPKLLYAMYLDERDSYANSSGFYLDVADLLFKAGERELGLRVLSNLAEMDLQNRHVLRILGYRLLEAGAPELAVPVFQKVQDLAPEEPQSYRDLGLAYAQAKRYQQAIDQLNEVITHPWDDRFAEIELITIAELNAIVATAPTKLDTSRIDPRLLHNLPLDVRAVMVWDSDNSDMDLWITDPNGEKCFFGHRFTHQGGRLSLDFTGGYGPEEFSLRHAKPGIYKVEANYFGSGQQVLTGATTVQVKLTTGFGFKSAKDKLLTLRLDGQGETVFVGEFEVK